MQSHNMKAIDLIREHTELLMLMERSGLAPSDVDYLPIVEEYEDMKLRGFKITFAVEYLASKHHVGVASLYRAIKRLNQNLPL